MDKFLWVGLGGAIGSIFRYTLSLLPIKSSFPILTLITNLLGAFIIGVVVGLFEKQYLSSQIHLFLKTGLCGGIHNFFNIFTRNFNIVRKWYDFYGNHLCFNQCCRMYYGGIFRKNDCRNKGFLKGSFFFIIWK